MMAYQSVRTGGQPTRRDRMLQPSVGKQVRRRGGGGLERLQRQANFDNGMEIPSEFLDEPPMSFSSLRDTLPGTRGIDVRARNLKEFPRTVKSWRKKSILDVSPRI
ncbi:unnamed protein product [Gongylonema pulchrum]|uniref:Uncharacterized protein n=1 Tax=Gongylonema pulchrum TaxID=637853 RepID=A0A183ELL2_9BILA|nr:unnamed protein product [Gongylonema pulchrum]